MYKIVEQSSLTEVQKEQLFKLWNQEYPVKLAYALPSDFEIYLSKLNIQTHFLLTDENEQILGWALLFERENEIWFAIIVDSSLQGKGFGSDLLERLKSKTDTLNGWVIDHDNDKKSDGTIYKSPINFYLRNRFKVSNAVRLELDIISAVKIEWTK